MCRQSNTWPVPGERQEVAARSRLELVQSNTGSAWKSALQHTWFSKSISATLCTDGAALEDPTHGRAVLEAHCGR